MQTNAIHLRCLLPLKTWKAKAYIWRHFVAVQLRSWLASFSLFLLGSGKVLCCQVPAPVTWSWNLLRLYFCCVTPASSKVQWFFFLMPLTHMTKYLVGNVFFMLNYPVVCLLKIKLSLAGSCMMEQEKKKKLGLCNQTDLGLILHWCQLCDLGQVTSFLSGLVSSAVKLSVWFGHKNER